MHSPVGQIEYTPSDSTPAFIWSLAFSGDGSHLAVGCWSGKTHIYELSRDSYDYLLALYKSQHELQSS